MRGPSTNHILESLQPQSFSFHDLHAVQHSAFRLVREGSASVRSQAEDSLSPRRGQEIWSSFRAIRMLYMFVCTMLIYVVLSCIITLEYLGGLGKKFLRHISPDHTNYTNPYVFFGLPKEVGGVLRMADSSLGMTIGYT